MNRRNDRRARSYAGLVLAAAIVAEAHWGQHTGYTSYTGGAVAARVALNMWMLARRLGYVGYTFDKVAAGGGGLQNVPSSPALASPSNSGGKWHVQSHDLGRRAVHW